MFSSSGSEVHPKAEAGAGAPGPHRGEQEEVQGGGGGVSTFKPTSIYYVVQNIKYIIGGGVSTFTPTSIHVNTIWNFTI